MICHGLSVHSKPHCVTYPETCVFCFAILLFYPLPKLFSLSSYVYLISWRSFFNFGWVVRLWSSQRVVSWWFSFFYSLKLIHQSLRTPHHQLFFRLMMRVNRFKFFLLEWILFLVQRRVNEHIISSWWSLVIFLVRLGCDFYDDYWALLLYGDVFACLSCCLNFIILPQLFEFVHLHQRLFETFPFFVELLLFEALVAFLSQKLQNLQTLHRVNEAGVYYTKLLE